MAKDVVVDERWLTPAQAAKLLECTPANVRRLADLGRVRCQRTPLGRLIDARDLFRLARERAGR